MNSSISLSWNVLMLHLWKNSSSRHRIFSWRVVHFMPWLWCPLLFSVMCGFSWEVNCSLACDTLPPFDFFQDFIFFFQELYYELSIEEQRLRFLLQAHLKLALRIQIFLSDFPAIISSNTVLLLCLSWHSQYTCVGMTWQHFPKKSLRPCWFFLFSFLSSKTG